MPETAKLPAGVFTYWLTDSDRRAALAARDTLQRILQRLEEDRARWGGSVVHRPALAAASSDDG